MYLTSQAMTWSMTWTLVLVQDCLRFTIYGFNTWTIKLTTAMQMAQQIKRIHGIRTWFAGKGIQCGPSILWVFGCLHTRDLLAEQRGLISDFQN